MPALFLALRRLRREPAMALAIVATTALAVGAATGVFVHLATYLFPRIAARSPERVGHVYLGEGGEPRPLSSYLELERLRAARGFEAVAAAAVAGATLQVGEVSSFAWGQLVSGEYFDFFGGQAMLGRLLDPGDEQPGAPPVAVISQRLWRGLFSSDPGVIGRPALVNGETVTVVGVMAPEFVGTGYASSFALPLTLNDRVTGVARLREVSERWLALWGRVPAGASGWASARAALAGVALELDGLAPLPAGGPRTPLLIPATRFDPSTAEDPMFQAARALAAAGLLFVLLGAGNLAGLLLQRVQARDREWAIRKALGAPPARLAAAILAEVALPAALGGIAALGVAALVVRWLEWRLLAPIGGIGAGWAGEGDLLVFGVEGLAFVVIATSLVAVMAAAPPLFRVLRAEPQGAWRAASGGAGGRALLAPRRLLVVAELALAVTLLAGGSLLVRSLLALADRDPGFDLRGLIAMTVYVPQAAGAEATGRLHRGLLEAARALPGVAAASLAHVPPQSGTSRMTEVAQAERPQDLASARYNIVGPGFFSTLGVPMLAGRELDARDAPGAPSAVVVNRGLADRLWPGGGAVGRRLFTAGRARPGEAGPEFEVVGVAADAAVTSILDLPTVPTVYFALGQRRHGRMTLVVRSAEPLAELEPKLRSMLAGVSATASVIDLVAVPEQFRRSLHPLRTNAGLAGALGLAGLLTAVAGLGSLQLYTVGLRRRELAVRVALGATARQLARSVLAEGAGLALAGAIFGLAGALGAVRMLRSVVVGLETLDLVTLASAPLILGVAVLLASWVPARRAARTHAAEVLRTP